MMMMMVVGGGVDVAWGWFCLVLLLLGDGVDGNAWWL